VAKLDLLGDIKKLPDKKFGGKESWIVRLEKKDPELFGQVVKIVDQWLDGEATIRRKLPSQTSVCEWLSPLLIERGHQVAVQTCNQIFATRKAMRDGQAAQ